MLHPEDEFSGRPTKAGLTASWDKLAFAAVHMAESRSWNQIPCSLSSAPRPLALCPSSSSSHSPTARVFERKLHTEACKKGKQIGGRGVGKQASACLALITCASTKQLPWSQHRWVSCTRCRCWHRSCQSTWRSSGGPPSAHTSCLAGCHGSNSSQSAPTWCPRCNCWALREGRG